jgi:hypothetical protein
MDIKWHDAIDDPPKEDGHVWGKLKGKKIPELVYYDTLFGWRPESHNSYYPEDVIAPDVVYWTPRVPPDFYD